jgi:hypothetical protein
MKSARLALLALAVAASQLPIFGVHAQSTLVIDCATHHLPAQQAVANALGLHNFGQTYAAREHVMETAHRACLRGASRVMFNGNDEAQQTTRMAHDQGTLTAANGSH